MKVRSRLLRNVLLVLMTIAGFETSFRVLYPEQLRTHSYPLVYQPHPVFGYRYVPRARGRICIPGICKDFTINENGYYGPSFERHKADGIYRVAMFGSSMWSGIWLDAEEDLAMKLQRRLKDGGFPVEVINFSVDGALRGMETVLLAEKETAVYGPDLVVLDVGVPVTYSDARREVYRGHLIIYGGSPPGLDREPRHIVDLVHELSWLHWVYDVSYTVRAACRFYLLHINPEGTSVPHMVLRSYVHKVAAGWIHSGELTLARSLAGLNALKRSLDERGIRLVLSVEDEPQARFLNARGFATMQVVLGDDPDLRHALDGHPSERGHDAMARQIFRNLVSAPGFPDPVETGAVGAATTPTPTP